MNIDIKEDLWSRLSKTDRPIIMYGMGNGADKILNVCEKYGICVSDFFASDGFVRGHSFHGKTVLSYSDVKRKYDGADPVILLSFASSLPSVMENFKRVGGEFELYAPDVPVFGDTLFNMDFYLENKDRFDCVYDMLADRESKDIYENVIKYKLSGDINLLWRSESDREEVYREILHTDTVRTYADLGTYNGDTIREMMKYCSGLENVIAFEPDRRNFRKLNDFAETVGGDLRIECVNAGAWSDDTVLSFNESGNRNAGISDTNGKNKVEVKMKTLDGVLNGRSVDHIKYDVEGSEKEALKGSERTISEFAPSLLVSMYHRSEDMFEIPLSVARLNGKYRLYIRRFPYVPAWDLNLYAVADEK